MKKGARTALYALLALVVVVGGGLIYVANELDGIVARLIEDQGSSATQTAVRVGGVSIELGAATGAISELTVGNPRGFAGNAVELRDFSLTLDPRSLTEDTIVVDDVTVSGAKLSVLQQAGRNNLRELLENLQAAGSDEAPAGEGGRKIIIDRFTLEGASATVSLPDLDEQREVELPTIVVRDIGRASGGATGAQVAQQLLRPLVERALSSAAAQTLRDRAAEELEEAAGGLLDGLNDALGGADRQRSEEEQQR